MVKRLIIFLLLINVCSFGQNTMVLSENSYTTVELIPHRHIIIDKVVTMDNLNIQGPAKLTITETGHLTIKGGLHLNGTIQVVNNGYLYTGDLELQNGNNSFINNGYYQGNVGQITDKSSWIKNCGTMEFKSIFSAHGKEGSIEFCNCESTFIVKGLDVTGYKPFKGDGFVKITGNTFNLNNYFGEGYLYYSGHINLIRYLENVTRVNENYICSTLPVIWNSVTFLIDRVKFSVSSPEKMTTVTLQVSNDGINWITYDVITIKPNQTNYEIKY